MPFCDAVALFEYWADYPPLHLMVRGHLGIEKRRPDVNMIETAQAMQVLGGRGRAPKLSSASEIDRARFATLKGKKKNAG